MAFMVGPVGHGGEIIAFEQQRANGHGGSEPLLRDPGESDVRVAPRPTSGTSPVTRAPRRRRRTPIDAFANSATSIKTRF